MTLAAEPVRQPNPQTAGRMEQQDRREQRMRQLIVGFQYSPKSGWEDRAECHGIDWTLFSLVDGDLQGVNSVDAHVENLKRHRAARRYCEACPVVAQCLGYALTREFEGTWGGELFTSIDWYAGRKVRKELEGE